MYRVHLRCHSRPQGVVRSPLVANCNKWTDAEKISSATCNLHIWLDDLICALRLPRWRAVGRRPPAQPVLLYSPCSRASMGISSQSGTMQRRLSHHILFLVGLGPPAAAQEDAGLSLGQIAPSSSIIRQSWKDDRRREVAFPFKLNHPCVLACWQ